MPSGMEPSRGILLAALAGLIIWLLIAILVL